jgi:hypothetical protein
MICIMLFFYSAQVYTWPYAPFLDDSCCWYGILLLLVLHITRLETPLPRFLHPIASLINHALSSVLAYLRLRLD